MSRSPDVKYQRLSQLDESDDEDEGFGDNILFDSRLVNGPTTDKRNIFEMEELGLPRVRPSGRYNQFTKRRRCCVAIIIVCLLIIGTGCGILIPWLMINKHPGKVLPVEMVVESVRDWNRTFYNAWTESSVFLEDIDKDKLDDIIIGLAHQSIIEDFLNRPQNVTMEQYCKKKGGEYPCGATITAFKGTDSTLLWQTNTSSIVFHQTCVDLEIAGDMKHCILTGRHSTCQAIEIYTGRIQWVVNPDVPTWSSHFVSKWNVYQAVVLPDLDGDGALDLLVSHGGDKDKEPWDHDRQAGRLILLSGLKGIPIGRFLELPDENETYMPPIKYVTSTGAIYILIGTGGETTRGSLVAISLADLYHAMMPDSDLSSWDSPVQYDWLDSKKKDQSGFVYLFRGREKGVMVPPVLVDADNDRCLDILVTTFDGQVTLLNGQSLEEMWTRSFDGMETYSSPAPGYFNDDSVLDWLIHLNQGVWDKYNSSQTLILDGSDGSVLWSSQAESYAYSSDLTLQKDVENSHVFIVKMVGVNSSMESVQEHVGLKKRHFGHELEDPLPQSDLNMTSEEFQMMCDSVLSDMKQKHDTCDQDLDSLTQDVLLFDNVLSNNPLCILQQKAERFHYQLDHKPGTPHCHPVSGRQKNKIEMCSVLTPTSYTGAVGDVDGDGHLDYVHVTQMMGTRYGDTYSPIEPISKVILSKLNLHSVMTRKDFVPLDTVDNDPGTYDDSGGGGLPPVSLRQYVDSIKFRALQGWCQYLGCRGDSWYHVPSS